MALLSRKKLAVLVIVGGPVAIGVDRLFLGAGGEPGPKPAGVGGLVDATMTAVVNNAIAKAGSGPGVADALSGLLDSQAVLGGDAASFDSMSDVFGMLAGPQSVQRPAEPETELRGMNGFRVSGVIAAGGGAAIVNGSIVRVGDAVGEAVLVRVEERTAVLLIGGQEVVHTVR